MIIKNGVLVPANAPDSAAPGSLSVASAPAAVAGGSGNGSGSGGASGCCNNRVCDAIGYRVSLCGLPVPLLLLVGAVVGVSVWDWRIGLGLAAFLALVVAFSPRLRRLANGTYEAVPTTSAGGGGGGGGGRGTGRNGRPRTLRDLPPPRAPGRG